MKKLFTEVKDTMRATPRYRTSIEVFEVIVC